MSERKMTHKLLSMIDDGALDPTGVVEMCVHFMSEDDVALMLRCNDILIDDESEE